MSITVKDKDGRIRRLDVEDVLGSEFDVSEASDDDDIMVRDADINILHDQDLETESEEPIPDEDADKELASLMEVLHSTESQFQNEDATSISDVPVSSNCSATSPLAFPLSPRNDLNSVDNVGGPSSSASCATSTPAKLKISPLLFNTNKTFSPLKTRKKRKGDSFPVADPATSTSSLIMPTVRRKLEVPVSATNPAKKCRVDAAHPTTPATSNKPPIRIKVGKKTKEPQTAARKLSTRVDAAHPTTSPATSNKPPIRVKVGKKTKVPQTATQKLSTSLKWTTRKYDDDRKPFTGQTDLADIFLKLETPYEYFKYFFDDDLVEHTVKESNRYCTTKNTKPLNMNPYDLLKYFGILTFSTVVQCSN